MTEQIQDVKPVNQPSGVIYDAFGDEIKSEKINTMTESDKIKFLKDLYLDTITKIMCNPNNTFQIASAYDLFDEVVTMAMQSERFDVDYYYYLVLEYQKFCEYRKTVLSVTTVLSIFLHRLSRKVQAKGSVNESADLAYKRLKDGIFCFESQCKEVSDLIKSTNTIFNKEVWNQAAFRDLMLFRLGLPFRRLHRLNVIAERNKGILNPVEFLSARKMVYLELLKLPSIYQNGYFHQLYEKIAIDNIKKMLPMLDAKIKDAKIKLETSIVTEGCS